MWGDRVSRSLKRTVRLNQLYAVYAELLTEKQKEAVFLYYSMDLSLAEIGARLGISRQAVRDTLMRATRALEDVETSLRLNDRLEQYFDLHDEMCGLIGEIRLQLRGLQDAEGSSDSACVGETARKLDQLELRLQDARKVLSFRSRGDRDGI